MCMFGLFRSERFFHSVYSFFIQFSFSPSFLSFPSTILKCNYCVNAIISVLQSNETPRTLIGIIFILLTPILAIIVYIQVALTTQHFNQLVEKVFVCPLTRESARDSNIQTSLEFLLGKIRTMTCTLCSTGFFKLYRGGGDVFQIYSFVIYERKGNDLESTVTHCIMTANNDQYFVT